MNNDRENYYKSLTGIRRAVPIILGALAVFVAICFLTKETGILGKGIGMTLRGLFSYASYATPLLLAIHALFYAEDVAKKRVVSRTVFSVCAIIAVSAIEYAICFWAKEPVFTPGAFFADASCGGFVGCVIGFVLMKLLGHIGVIVVTAAALAIYAIFFFADRTGAFGRKAKAFGRGVASVMVKTKDAIDDSIEKKKAEKAEREAEEHILKSDDLMNDPFFYENSGVDGLKVDNGNIHEPGKHKAAEPEHAVAEEKTERRGFGAKRKKRADKQLDLTYGIDVREETEKAPEGTVSDEPEEAPAPSRDAFMANDSAESVFTKDFDPFDFATGEKIAAKPSSRAMPIEEELDDLMPPPKKEPSVKDQRHADFEEKKQQWLKNRTPEAPTATHSEPAATVAASPSAPLRAEEPAKFEAPAATPTAAEATFAADPTPARAPEAPSGVNTYTSYTSTQTTYTQPIKTVEFTVTASPKPSYAEPRVTESVIRTYDKSTPHAESAEDIATVIAERIAKANPAYARSANEMVTYTKITPSPEELEAELALAKADAEPDDVTVSFDESESGESSIASSVAAAAEDESVLTFSFDTDESAKEPVAPMSEETVIPTYAEADVPEEEIAESKSESVTETVEFEDEEVVAPQIAEETVAVEEDATSDGGSRARSAYERAAGFAAALDDFSTEAVAEAVKAEAAPEFKPYTPPTVSSESYFAPEENTLTVERDMVAPTLTEETVSEPKPAKPVEEAVADKQAKEATAAQSAESAPAYTVINEDTVFDEEVTDEPVTETAAQNDILWSPDENGESEDDSDDSDTEVLFDDDAEETDVDSEEEEEEFDGNIADAMEEEEEEVAEIPPEEQNPDVIKMREMFPFLAPLGKQAEPTPEKNVEPEPVPEDEPPFDEPTAIKSKPSQAALAVEPVKEEKKKPDYSDYKFPPIEFLAKEESNTDVNIQAEIQENADRLIETLSSFNVTASIKGVDRGPRITRYEVVPAKGVKVSSILNLQDDIALNLAAGAIRMEAPIPGKSAVGIEIPNKKSSTVRLRDLLENEEFINSKSKTFVCIGRDVAGQPVFGDIAKMPHLLIAGATGMGKSVCINSLMISILFKAKPDEVKFIMIDPKQVEFTMYNGIPHLLVPVVSDPKQAAGALMWAVEEMERRYNLLNPLCVRNIDAYNEKVTNDPSLGEFLPRIIIVIDEFADLMLQVKDPVESLVMRIAQKARAAGIYLIIGTQRPSVNVITGVIKANVPSRISCKVMSNVDSKTVLDSAGAEKLLDRGDMLYAPAGALKPHRVQGAFVADSEVEAIMNYLKQYSEGSSYDSNVMEEIERAAQKCSKKGSGGGADHESDDDEVYGEGYLNDRQFLDAVEIAVNTRKISTSLIQRKLSIGYGKAAKFIDIMEDKGIVGEANGQRPREVLVTPDEWREMLARTTYDN